MINKVDEQVKDETTYHSIRNLIKLPGKWRAEYGCNYFTITLDGSILEMCETNTTYDWNRYIIGNYFESESDAKTSQFYTLVLNELEYINSMKHEY
jgi:hypothetical protein